MSHPWIYKLQLSSLRLISLHQGVPYSIFISIVTELFEQLNWASWIFQASKSTNDFLLDLQKLQGIWTSGTEASALNIQKWLPVFSAIRYAFCILFFLFFFFFWLGKGSCVTTKTTILRSILATYKASWNEFLHFRFAKVIVFGAEKLMVTSELKILTFSNIIHICDVIGPKYSPNWPQISLITP